MKHFILEDQLIENIKKNISLFNDYYKHNVESIYFNNLKYNDYFLSILYPKNHIFNDFVNSNKNLIIPTIGISRILPSSNMSSFIAHKHLYDVDDVIYHYIVKCNSRCGMIIGDEYLPYKDELIFGFKADKTHIAFNFGETIKDSFQFLTLNRKYSLKEWNDTKIKSLVSDNFSIKQLNKKYALRKIKNFLK